MKTPTFLRLSLLAPYILWGLLAGGFALVSEKLPTMETRLIVEIIAAVVFFYTIGIVIWGVPYTVLAIFLWLWSINKSSKRMGRVFAFSPLLMTLLVAVEMIVIYLLQREGASPDFGQTVAVVSLLSIPFGYLLIGVVAGIYVLMRKIDFIKVDNEETSPQPA